MASTESREAGTWGALVALLVVSFGLLGLIALVTPHLLGVVLVVGGLGGFVVMHYVLWGWWLGQSLTHDAELRDNDGRPS